MSLLSIDSRFKLVPLTALCMALAACGGSGTTSTDGSESADPASEVTEDALGLPAVPGPVPTSQWTRVAVEGQSFTLTAPVTVVFGAGTSFYQRTLTGTNRCSTSVFGGDLAWA